MGLSKTSIFTTALTILLATNPLSAIAAKSQLNDSAITSAEKGSLATVATIDKNEILVSIVALNKKVDSGVADFAKMMIDQHGSNLTQILEMVNNLHALPLAGGDAEKLAAQGKKNMIALGALSGNQFEKAYVDAMVTGHEAALKLIDTHLMKTAKSESVKKFLTETKSVVEVHLEHAKKLQEKMKS